MTGKPLAVTQKQVTAILKGAAKAGMKLVKITAVNGEVFFDIIIDDRQDHKHISMKPKRAPNFDI